MPRHLYWASGNETKLYYDKQFSSSEVSLQMSMLPLPFVTSKHTSTSAVSLVGLCPDICYSILHSNSSLATRPLPFLFYRFVFNIIHRSAWKSSEKLVHFCWRTEMGEAWERGYSNANFSFCLTDAVGIVKTAMESNTTKLFHYDRNQAVEILRLQNNTAAR